MSRLLFWIGLIVLLVMAVRSKLREAAGPRQGARRASQPSPAPTPAAAQTAPERMACCAHCGLHFPASESVRAGGRDYCCPAHAPK
jgi:uncharacterized protein